MGSPVRMSLYKGDCIKVHSRNESSLKVVAPLSKVAGHNLWQVAGRCAYIHIWYTAN